jgi:hypothetical protein
MQNHYLDIWLLIQNIRKVMMRFHHHTHWCGSSVNFSYLLKKINIIIQY